MRNKVSDYWSDFLFRKPGCFHKRCCGLLAGNCLSRIKNVIYLEKVCHLNHLNINVKENIHLSYLHSLSLYFKFHSHDFFTLFYFTLFQFNALFHLYFHFSLHEFTCKVTLKRKFPIHKFYSVKKLSISPYTSKICHIIRPRL